MRKKDRSDSQAIEKRKSQLPSKRGRAFTIGQLEEAMLKEFPAEDAESWDRTGVLVGERGLPAKRVALALDPTVSAIEKAAASNADVLITHHPAYISAPDSFAPEPSVALSPGAGVFAAIKNRVALMDFHTALDVSKKAQRVLPAMLGLDFKGEVALPIPESKDKGYGQVCRFIGDGEVGGTPETLAYLAARCTSVFGRAPRVWGEMGAKVSKVITATGSASNLVDACIGCNADCLVCGEVKYHDALALSDAGVAVIELGHDVSELPLVAVLAEAVANAGFSKDDIVIIDQSDNWSYPEAVRI